MSRPYAQNASANTIISEFQAIVASLVGGGKYGTKIRLPHAAVMTILFRKETSVQEKLRIVMKLTFAHSRNLASFAAIYKVRVIFLWIMIGLQSMAQGLKPI